MRLISLIALISALSLVSAASMVTHDLSMKDVSTTLTLDGQAQTLRLPLDADNIVVNGPYSISSDGTFVLLQTTSTQVTYTSTSHLEQSGKGYVFILKSPLFEPVKTQVILPQSAYLDEQGIIFPSNYTLTTDGKRITIIFPRVEDELLLRYETTNNNAFFWYATTILALAIIAWFITHKIHSKKHLTKNLYREEKEIVTYLAKKKGQASWTKNIVKDLNISKVTLSRKLRSLEEKGLIKKEPHGNENRITLIRS